MNIFHRSQRFFLGVAFFAPDAFFAIFILGADFTFLAFVTAFRVEDGFFFWAEILEDFFMFCTFDEYWV